MTDEELILAARGCADSLTGYPLGSAPYVLAWHTGRLCTRVAELNALVRSLTERLAAQSELLSKRAEREAGELHTPEIGGEG